PARRCNTGEPATNDERRTTSDNVGTTNIDNNRVAVAVLGAGFISDYHITGLQAAGADVRCVSSRNLAKAQQKADQYGIPTACADYREVLARPDVEAVIIATPDVTHAELAIAAANAGKAILLQKPMARTSAEGRRIIAAADQAGVPLVVSFMHRYFEEVDRTRALLAEHALGHVHLVRQHNATQGADWAAWFYSKAHVGGGVVLQLGVHGIDLLRCLFGEIEAVKAVTTTATTARVLADGSVVHPDNEDLAVAIYRFASGALAVHEMSYNEVAGTDRFRMEIYGDRGAAWLRTERGRLALSHGRDEWLAPDLPPEAAGERQHRHFLAMVRGEAPLDSSAHDGLAALLVAEAIYRSAAAGDWEQVDRL
ncbi:MAG: Gfo/Idh/MocA family protein, partial [Thermomicrobiales bacterium]